MLSDFEIEQWSEPGKNLRSILETNCLEQTFRTFKISGEGSEENDEHGVENMYHFELVVDRYM